MSDYLNLSISVIALAVATASAIYTWLEHRRAARLRIRDELIEAIATFDRYEAVLRAMTRERDKTGTAKNSGEQDIFEKFETASAEYELLKDALRKILINKPGSLDEGEMTELRSAKQMAESLIAKIEMLFERFKRFNDNRLPELKRQMESLQRRLASLAGG